MLILGSEKGRVRRVIKDDADRPALLTFPTFNFTSLHAIVQKMSSEFKPGYQVTDTLGDDIYLLSFGESVSPVMIGGLIFEDVCDEDDEAADIAGDLDEVNEVEKGVQQVISWWEEQNLSRKRDPIQLTIGTSRTMQVFLAELSIVSEDPRDKVWRFSMNLIRVPRRPEVLDNRFAEAAGDVSSPPGQLIQIEDPGVDVLPNPSDPPDPPDRLIDMQGPGAIFLPNPTSPFLPTPAFIRSGEASAPDSATFGENAIIPADGFGTGDSALVGVVSGT